MVSPTTSNPLLYAKPGIYPGLTFEQYTEIPAMNGSALEWGQVSMAHLRAYLDGEIEEKESEARDFGIALHACAFEPIRLNGLISDGPINARTEKPYGRNTDKFREWREENPGLIVLSREDRERLPKMAASLLAHKKAAELLTHAGEREATVVWQHEMKGVRPILCKGRIDVVATDVALVDLKSVESAAPDDFSKAVLRYGWHRKAAMYRDGWRAITGEDLRFVFVAAEKSPPYAVAVYALSEAAISIGRSEYCTTLWHYGSAVKAKTYPAYSDDILDLDLPRWYARGFGDAA